MGYEDEIVGRQIAIEADQLALEALSLARYLAKPSVTLFLADSPEMVAELRRLREKVAGLKLQLVMSGKGLQTLQLGELRLFAEQLGIHNIYDGTKDSLIVRIMLKRNN